MTISDYVWGVQRLYIVDLPTRQRPNMPLLMVFHGGDSNAKGWRKLQPWHEFAASLGIVVVYGEVYSEGTGNWNSEPMPGVGWEIDSEISDVLYVEDVLADLAARGISINPNKIYARGYSSGGYMAYHLAACRTEACDVRSQ
jgi:poly(3-hydroxybutyrate) depolymerase